MILDALKYFGDLAAKAAGEAKVTVTRDPRRPGRLLLLRPDGTHGVDEFLIDDRHHTLESVDQFSQLLAQFPEGTFPNATIWVGSKDGWGIAELVFDNAPESHRRDRAVCVLSPTPEYLALASAQNLDQKRMRSLLRHTLADCDVPPRLLVWVSNVRWSARNEAKGVIVAGRESLGRDVELSADSVGELPPEDIDLNVRIFTDRALPERRTIRFGFDVDLETRTMSLVPRGDALAQALDYALLEAANVVGETTDLDVVMGRP